MSLRNSLRVRGVSGTVHLMFRRCLNFKRAPRQILSRTIDLESFDRQHGVETAGLIELDQLRFNSSSKTHGARYDGIAPWRLKDLLRRIPVDLDRHTFVDVGSGKGAALFHASEYPFRKIVGVEFSPELHEVALRNIASFRSSTRQCNDITAICGDAGSYEYPEGPCVLFFNSPFGVPVWEKVARNLARSRRGQGKSYLIYSNIGWLPEAAEFVDKLSFLRLIHADDTSRVYEFIG